MLALKRRGVADHAWQMPQGGIDAGQTPRQAVLRELREESGLQPPEVELLAEHPHGLVYEPPPELRRPSAGWGRRRSGCTCARGPKRPSGPAASACASASIRRRRQGAHAVRVRTAVKR